ncbi:leucine-rich repeat protein [uncultured Ruminococcus sp.]|uniref:leucine-rich repeat protein n=1 Tax=uncultured Ruminococcus sp. TaxID=165186 RepID=UPI0026062F44|nr:leucine-rich repeat protein [uncultured Ruminococcus sp.]
MRTMKKRIMTMLMAVIFTLAVFVGQPFLYTDLIASALQETDGWMWEDASDGSAVIRDYVGTDESVTIPTQISTSDAYGGTLKTKPVHTIGVIGGYFQPNSTVTSVRIRKTLTGMVCSPFCTWKRLTRFTVDDDNEVYSDIDGVLFNKTKTELVCYPAGRQGAYTIPDGVTSIGYGAFRGCTGLTAVSIPDSVTHIDMNAFMNCSSLQEVMIPDTVTEIEDDAFDGCSALSSVKIGRGITELIGIFKNCTALTAVTIPDNVVTIGSAFEGCENLVSVQLPKNITELLGTFNGCTKLSSIALPDSLTKIGEDTFCNCKSLRSVDIPASVTEIQNSAFLSCSNLTSVKTQDGLKYIGRYAFRQCSSLTDIIIPKSVYGIDIEAFSLCTSLNSVTIYNPGCTIIEGYRTINNGYSDALIRFDYSGTIYGYANSTAQKYAKQCRYKFVSLGNDCDYKYKVNSDGQSVTLTGYTGSDTEIVIPSTLFGTPVTVIGEYLFDGNKNLVSVTIPDGVTSIEDSAFRSCTNLQVLSMPKSLETIGSSAFSGCSGLTNITIPDGVTKIETYAFSGCSGLTNISIPESTESIGCGAFSCEKLSSATIYNRDCKIDERLWGAIRNGVNTEGVFFTGTIFGHANSTAQSYAEKFGFPFEEISETDTTTTVTESTTTQLTTNTTSVFSVTSISANPDTFYGDTNLDGRVDITDAVLLNKAAAGSVTLNDKAAANADCNGNGELGNDDALILLKFLVHLVSTLPCIE